MALPFSDLALTMRIPSLLPWRSVSRLLALCTLPRSLACFPLSSWPTKSVTRCLALLPCSGPSPSARYLQVSVPILTIHFFGFPLCCFAVDACAQHSMFFLQLQFCAAVCIPPSCCIFAFQTFLLSSALALVCPRCLCALPLVAFRSAGVQHSACYP
ncbi:hypothetical protein TRVL_04017 [Trypanosoma vivax]|nr:hypothetical protein TRVL_04017 [Trypanosoma vivax]